MSVSSSVPAIEFTQTGVVMPTEAAILAGVQEDNNAAFGGNLNPGLATPQGQLASSLTAIVGDSNAVFGEFVNQVDPDYASGFMQDAIARIYFLMRQGAVPTAVSCDCLGLSGTVIPTGAQAVAEDGNIYVCTGGGTIPIGGTVSLQFACIVDGPIACPAESLNAIYQAIPGWDRVVNPSDGEPGRLVESRADFEFRRRNSVALNAHGSLLSVYAAVFDVPDVLDVYCAENTTGATITIGSTSFPLIEHSLYVGVIGGAAAAIANAIWSKKDLGCDYNGNTSVVVTDDSGYDYPQPTYTVKFQILDDLPVLFAVELANNPGLPADIVALTKAAMIAAFNGADGGQRARAGAAIFASRYYAPVTAVAPGVVSILSIFVGSVTPTLNSIIVGVDQYPTLTEDDISVTLV